MKNLELHGLMLWDKYEHLLLAVGWTILQIKRPKTHGEPKIGYAVFQRKDKIRAIEIRATDPNDLMFIKWNNSANEYLCGGPPICL